MTDSTILVAGASRGLGLALAAGFADRGWQVIGTVRDGAPGGLDALARAQSGRVTIETLDIAAPDSVNALRNRLDGRRLDALLVNAGITTQDPLARLDAVEQEEFTEVMVTNALGPMRLIGALRDLVPADGLIAAMSSGQGSITANVAGTRDVYRASKAALNMLMRSFAAREDEATRRLLLLAPGWVRTDLGGDTAPYSIEETVPLLIDLMLAKRGRPGLEYLDRFGKTVPW